MSSGDSAALRWRPLSAIAPRWNRSKTEAVYFSATTGTLAHPFLVQHVHDLGNIVAAFHQPVNVALGLEDGWQLSRVYLAVSGHAVNLGSRVIQGQHTAFVGRQRQLRDR